MTENRYPPYDERKQLSERYRQQVKMMKTWLVMIKEEVSEREKPDCFIRGKFVEALNKFNQASGNRCEKQHVNIEEV